MKKTIPVFVLSLLFLLVLAIVNPIYASLRAGVTSIEIECEIKNVNGTYFAQREITEMDELITFERSMVNDSRIRIFFYSDKAEEYGRITPGVKSFLKNELQTTLPELCSVDITYLQDNLIQDMEKRLNSGPYELVEAFFIFDTKNSRQNLIDRVNQYDKCDYPIYEIQEQWIIGEMGGTREYCTNNRGLYGYPQINSGDYLSFLISNMDYQTFPYLAKHLLHLSPLLVFAISVPASLFYMLRTKRYLSYFVISVLTTPITFILLILLRYSWIIDSNIFNAKNEMLMSPFLVGSVVYLLWVWTRNKMKKLKG